MNTSRLTKLINKLADEPFKYGKNDCLMFAGRLAEAYHGKSLKEKKYLTRHLVYKSEKEADEYIARYGHIENLITGTLGYSIDPTKCVDGDVVTAGTDERAALGFVLKGHGLFKMEKKIMKVPLKKCRKGWRLS